MENINLSDITGDNNCVNSFALAFRSMFCTEIIPPKNRAEKLIKTYLKEYEHEISLYFNNIDQYCFVTNTLLKKREMIDDKIEKLDIYSDEDEIYRLYMEKRLLEYTQLFNSGIYNLGTILSYLDENAENDLEILYNNSFGNYSNVSYFLLKRLVCLQLSIWVYRLIL